MEDLTNTELYLNYMFFCCKQSCSFLNTLITYFPRFNWNFEIKEIFADDLCLCDEKIWWGCPRPHLLSHGWSAKCQPASFHKSIGNTKSWRKNLERNCESLNLGLVHSIEENVELVSNMSANVFQKINQKNKPAKSWWKFTFRTGTQHWGERAFPTPPINVSSITGLKPWLVSNMSAIVFPQINQKDN